MDRRTLAAGVAVLVLVPAGLTLLAPAAVPHVPLGDRRGLSPITFALQVGAVVLAGVAVFLLTAHQYVRWEPYRPAIHLTAGIVAFVAALVWWLGPDVMAGPDPLTGRERRTIRIAGVGMLLYLLFFLARYLDGDDGGT